MTPLFRYIITSSLSEVQEFLIDDGRSHAGIYFSNSNLTFFFIFISLLAVWRWRLPENSLEISFYFLPSVHMDMDIHRADGGKGIQDKTNTTTFVFSTCPFRQVKKQMKKRIHFHFRVLSSKWFVVVVVVGRAKYEPIRYTHRERKRETL